MPQRAEWCLRKAWLQVLRGTARVGRRLRAATVLSDRLIRRFAFTAHAPQQLVEQVRDNFLSTDPDALARTALATNSDDWMALAPPLRVPMLVLHGDQDPEVPREQVEELMRLLPDGERVTFSGAGHMLPLTHSGEVAQQIARWVQRAETM